MRAGHRSPKRRVLQFDLIIDRGQQFGRKSEKREETDDSNYFKASGLKQNNLRRICWHDFHKKLGVRSAQFLYIVPCTVNPGWFAAKDLMVIGDRNMKAIREYLKHKPCLRGQILDRGELKRVAQACGLSPQQARLELKGLGFILTQNNHGLTIWKRLEEDPIGKREP